MTESSQAEVERDPKKVAESLTGMEDYMIRLDCFGMDFGYLGRPLMVPPSSESGTVFESMMRKGLVWPDTERGQFGYRATDLAFDVRRAIAELEASEADQGGK